MKRTIFFLSLWVILMSSDCASTGGSNTGGFNNNISCATPNQNTHQEDAEVYLNWDWNGDYIVNIDQVILPNKLAASSSWRNYFQFLETQGGHMGLETDQTGEGNNGFARFFLWEANGCELGDSGGSCSDFVDENLQGKTITFPLQIFEEHEYHFRLWYYGADNEDEWWGCHVADNTLNKEYFLGKIRVPNSDRVINSLSYSKYYGGSFTDKNCVPQSVVSYFQPTANNDDNNNSYQYIGTYSSSVIGDGANGLVETTTINNSDLQKITLGGE